MTHKRGVNSLLLFTPQTETNGFQMGCVRLFCLMLLLTCIESGFAQPFNDCFFLQYLHA